MAGHHARKRPRAIRCCRIATLEGVAVTDDRRWVAESDFGDSSLASKRSAILTRSSWMIPTAAVTTTGTDLGGIDYRAKRAYAPAGPTRREAPGKARTHSRDPGHRTPRTGALK
jgi:hypothetical protein